jgi:signal transduction histidine kinase/CheY-like chemotaxis protein
MRAHKAIAFSRLAGSNAASLFLAVSLLSIWVFIAYDLNRTHDQAFDQARMQLHNLTKLYAEEVSSSIAAINYVLVDLREEWKGNRAEFDALVQFRQVHLDPSVAFNVGIIDADGTLIYTSSDWDAKPVDLSDRRYFQFHYYNRGDGLYISEPVLLRVANRWAIQFTRPLSAARGEFNGVIALSVSPEYFSRFHESIDLGKNSSIALARITGELLARSPDPELALGASIRSAPWMEGFNGAKGFFQKYSEADLVERLYAWRVLEGGTMAVIIGQSVDTILAPYYQQRRIYLTWGIAATAALLLAAYLIGRNRLQRARAAADMAKMEETLARSQKLESLGKLTGGVTHDFNNILQVISSNLDLLAMTGANNKQLEPYVNSMSDAVDRGSKLASQLLTFARRQPMHPVVVNPKKLIKGIDSLIQRLVGNDIAVKTSIADNTGNVEVDPALFENVILNLAANARDAMEGQGALTINVGNETIDEHRAADYPGITPGEYVTLAMKDTGSGMPPEVVEHVFEPFFTTKPEGEGTGLGLAAAYGFVKESGGHIHIDSKIGVGTTIRIFLPRSSKNEKKASHPARKMEGGTETILMVEDNAELRRMTGAMLEHLGYRVLQAPNPQEALEIIRKDNPIDVLFTDVLMPGGMNGVELARQAKAMRPGLAILLASGSYDLEESLKEFHAEIGAVYFLQKPYKVEQVDATIRKLLSQKAGLK